MAAPVSPGLHPLHILRGISPYFPMNKIILFLDFQFSNLCDSNNKNKNCENKIFQTMSISMLSPFQQFMLCQFQEKKLIYENFLRKLYKGVSRQSGVDSSSPELLRKLLRDVEKINAVLISEKMKVVRSRNLTLTTNVGILCLNQSLKSNVFTRLPP